ncbi:hypothetical protein ACK14O_14350 [Vibrio harveyi]|uniref:hypothetical protein n=1 Tax=Vibrio harveyi TaxID=669 RepID=UPI00390B6F8B
MWIPAIFIVGSIFVCIYAIDKIRSLKGTMNFYKERSQLLQNQLNLLEEEEQERIERIKLIDA